MTQPHLDPNAATPEGYDPPATAPFKSEQYPTASQPPQPYAGPQQPYLQPQYQGYPPAPQGPQYQGYPPAPQGPQYQGYPPAPQAPQYQGHPPAPLQSQYQQQPPMRNPAYGYPQPKSKLVAGLLGIFLGGLGIHRFYLGFTKIAVIQLILTVLLGALTFGIVCLWGVIEGIMIIAGSAHFQRDGHGVPLRD